MVLVPNQVAARKDRRRVRVACSACAARKLRCDGLRPCGRCVNLHLTETCQDREVSVGCRRPRRRLQAPACSACSYSKVACSAERPCPRCVRLGLGPSCVASTLQLPRKIPRMWAYELVPLAVDLPFPRHIREFWVSWPNAINPLLAINLALSPERLDKLIGCMLWALTSDDVRKLRLRFDSFKMITSTSDSSCVPDNVLQAVDQDFTPELALPDTPEIEYCRDTDTTLTMNSAAFSVLGYSTETLKEAVQKSVHCYTQNPNYLPFIFKLFHPDSWQQISTAILKYYLFKPVCQRFYCQLARCDGRPVHVYMAMSIWVNEDYRFRVRLSFTVVEPTTLVNNLVFSAIAKAFE